MPNQPHEAIDVNKLLDLLQKAAENAPQLVLAIKTLLFLFQGEQHPALGAAQEIKCGPDGEKDCKCCLDHLIECQTHALALAIQAKVNADNAPK